MKKSSRGGLRPIRRLLLHPSWLARHAGKFSFSLLPEEKKVGALVDGDVICRKSFNSANAQADHLHSKKHRDAVFKAASKIRLDSPQPTEPVVTEAVVAQAGPSDPALSSVAVAVEQTIDSAPAPDGEEPSIETLVARRLETVPPVPLLTCLFCPSSFDSLDSELSHMLQVHGFFIPDAEYLVDREGLIKELGVRVGTWNVCLFCDLGFGGKVEGDDVRRNNRGLEAVRKHMCDKVNKWLLAFFACVRFV
jgi:pre-60S factor REI1